MAIALPTNAQTTLYTRQSVLSGTSMQFTKPSGLQDGDVLLLICAKDDNPAFSTPTGGGIGDDWNELAQWNPTTYDDLSLGIWWQVVADASTATTVTASWSDSEECAGILMVVTGADTTTFSDQTPPTPSYSNEITNPNPPGITTQTDGAVVMAIVSTRTGGDLRATSLGIWDWLKPSNMTINRDATPGTPLGSDAEAAPGVVSAGEGNGDAQLSWAWYLQEDFGYFGPNTFSGATENLDWIAATIAIKPEAAGDQDKNDTDSGALTDNTPALTPESSRTDSGALSAGTPSVELTGLTDSGALTDPTPVLDLEGLTDSGALTDPTPTLEVDISSSDSGTLIEVVDDIELEGLTDSGTLSEDSDLSATAPKAGSDSGTLSEGIPDIALVSVDDFEFFDLETGDQSKQAVDSGTLSSASVLDRDFSSTDNGTLSSASVLDGDSSSTDSGTLSSASLIDSEPVSTDSGTLSEAQSLDKTVLKSGVDSGTLSSASVSEPEVSGTDSGALSEVISGEAELPSTDSGTLSSGSELDTSVQKEGIDSGALSSAITAFDSDGLAVDSAALSSAADLDAELPSTDSGALSSSSDLDISKSGTDSGTLSSASVLDRDFVGSDSGSLSSSADLDAELSSTDSGTLSEDSDLDTGAIPKIASDTFYFLDYEGDFQIERSDQFWFKDAKDEHKVAQDWFNLNEFGGFDFWDRFGEDTFGFDEARLIQTGYGAGTFWDDWAFPDFQAWDSDKWDISFSDSVIDCVDEEGRILLQSPVNSFAKAEAKYIVPTVDDSVYFEYQQTYGTGITDLLHAIVGSPPQPSIFRVYLRSTGVGEFPDDGYFIELRPELERIHVGKVVSGVETIFDWFAYTFDAGMNSIRFEIIGSTVQAKAWTGSEGEWDYITSDSSVTDPGYLRIVSEKENYPTGHRIDNIDSLGAFGEGSGDLLLFSSDIAYTLSEALGEMTVEVVSSDSGVLAESVEAGFASLEKWDWDGLYLDEVSQPVEAASLSTDSGALSEASVIGDFWSLSSSDSATLSEALTEVASEFESVDSASLYRELAIERAGLYGPAITLLSLDVG